MTAYDCPACKGKCCRDTDFGYRVYHMGSESYEHWCEHCHDGSVPPPDPRDLLIEQLRAEIEEHRKAQAAVYLALGTGEPDRDKWPELIEQLRCDLEKKDAKIAVLYAVIEAAGLED